MINITVSVFFVGGNNIAFDMTWDRNTYGFPTPKAVSMYMKSNDFVETCNNGFISWDDNCVVSIIVFTR